MDDMSMCKNIIQRGDMEKQPAECGSSPCNWQAKGDAYFRESQYRAAVISRVFIFQQNSADSC